MSKFFLYYFSIILCIASAKDALAQKPVIDSNTYKTWKSLDWGSKISNDGNYIIYSIKNEPIGSTTLIIKNLRNSKEVQIKNAAAFTAQFTENNKVVIFIKQGNLLGMLKLASFQIEYIENVSSFNLPKNGDGTWFAYKVEDQKKTLVLKNTITGKEKIFEHVNDYKFNKDGTLLVLNVTVENNSTELQVVSTKTLLKQTIWNGTKVKDILLDESGKKMAFLTEDLHRKYQDQIWYFNSNKDKTANLLVDSLRLNNGLCVENILDFTKDGSSIIITLKDKSDDNINSDLQSIPLVVWSYSDTKLQSQQAKELQKSRKFTLVINVTSKKLYRLENENDHLENLVNHKELGLIALLYHTDGNAGDGEFNWNKAAQITWYLKFAKYEQEVLLKDLKKISSGSIKISPDAKYLLYYDPEKANYFSYNINTANLTNITKGIKTCWQDNYKDDLPLTPQSARGIAGWLRNSKVLIYDKFDLWLIDLKGQTTPINLTNGYGTTHKIKFDLEFINRNEFFESNVLIFNSFNSLTKENGFYEKKINKIGDPLKLYTGPYIFNLVKNPSLDSDAGFNIIKSRDQHKYLIRRMSENESPNLFTTNNFKEFTPVSHINPEKVFNWLTTELHSWKSLDGRLLQGILYKPENFNPNIKYPVIFHYYERKSDGLHYFIQPEYLTSGCTINIPSYVSNGYLVFSPDIHYTVGDPMQGTYDAVVSAAHYIANMPFIDSTKMGIQGCSFGGVQTDYLVTHTNVFAAAVSASGIADFVATSGSIGDDGSSTRSLFETGQIRMGYSLWERPDLYIKNSPIFFADKVNTPFLMMHTTKDNICPIEDALEFFTALRRLGKKAWLLEYQNSNHGLWGKPAVDFSTRMNQFFNYYLKDKPAPYWMIKGIPAKLKGIDRGLELAPVGVSPGPGLLDLTLSISPKVR